MPSRMKHPARLTLSLNSTLWDRTARAAGLGTESEQAAKLGISRTHLSRIRHGHSAPGPEFIAAVRRHFPDVDERALFPVVKKPAA